MIEYIKSAFLGILAVVILNGFLSFSYVSVMFAFINDASYILAAQVLYGAFMGFSVQYLRNQSNLHTDRKNPYLDLRYVLAVLVYSMFLTYLITLSAYMTCFPLVIAGLYFVSLIAFSTSMSGYDGSDISWLKRVYQLVNAGLLGAFFTTVFWFCANTVLLSNPLIGSLWLWATTGAVLQACIVGTMFDGRINVLTQWVFSLSALAISLVALSLVYQPPILSLCLFTLIPTIYGFIRAYVSTFDDKNTKFFPAKFIIHKNDIGPENGVSSNTLQNNLDEESGQLWNRLGGGRSPERKEIRLGSSGSDTLKV